MRRGWVESAVIMLGVLTVSCGGSGSHASTSQARNHVTASSAVSITTTTMPRNPDGDRALARSAVLTLADLPSGWTAKPHVPTSVPSVDRDIASCLHVPITAINTDLAPHADSEDFSLPGSLLTLQNGVAVFASPSEATAVVNAAAKSNFPACFATAVANELRRKHLSGGTNTEAANLAIAPVGDHSTAIRGIVALGTHVIAYSDLLFAQRGRAIAFIVEGVPGISPPNHNTEDALLAKVVARLSAAAR